MTWMNIYKFVIHVLFSWLKMSFNDLNWCRWQSVVGGRKFGQVLHVMEYRISFSLFYLNGIWNKLTLFSVTFNKCDHMIACTSSRLYVIKKWQCCNVVIFKDMFFPCFQNSYIFLIIGVRGRGIFLFIYL